MPDHFYVYPAYLARAQPRSGGRRLPSDRSVTDPTAEEIAQAAKRLGYRAELEGEKQYPRTSPEGPGRVKVVKRADVSKARFLREVADELRRLRTAGGKH